MRSGLVSRQFLIDRSHQWRKLLVKAGKAAGRLSGIPPYLLHFTERHIRAGRVTVQQILVQRIAAFNFDVIHLFPECGIADQHENQIVKILKPVGGRHSDDVVLIERREDCGNGRLRNRLRAIGPRLAACGQDSDDCEECGQAESQSGRVQVDPGAALWVS